MLKQFAESPLAFPHGLLGRNQLSNIGQTRQANNLARVVHDPHTLGANQNTAFNSAGCVARCRFAVPVENTCRKWVANKSSDCVTRKPTSRVLNISNSRRGRPSNSAAIGLRIKSRLQRPAADSQPGPRSNNWKYFCREVSMACWAVRNSSFCTSSSIWCSADPAITSTRERA